MTPALPFAVPDAVAEDHALVVVTCAPGLGWWAECACGWIGPGYRSEDSASASHQSHQRCFIGAAP